MQSVFSVLSSSKEPVYLLDPSKSSLSRQPPLRFKLRGIEYMRKADIASKIKREPTSIVWQYGEALVRLSDNKEVFYCYDCEHKGTKQKLPSASGTRNARNYLKDQHRRDLETGEVQKPSKPFSGMVEGVANVVDVYSFDAFKRKLLRWFVGCQIALNMLVNPLFRDLVCYLNSALGGLLPKARATLRAWIIGAYEKEKELVKASIKHSQSKLHLSFDIWTAPSWIAVICVWGYWIDAKGQQQRRMLAFRRIYASHDGESQAEILLEVLKEYKAEERVGYFVCDNATSNDAAVKIVLQQLFPSIKDSEITARRLRCFGHVVNLCAQSLLAATSSEVKQSQEELEIDEDDRFSEAACAWIVKGPLGKLHRVSKYILASSQRREEFGEVKGGRKVAEFDNLGLLQDNSTRWNSWHRALTRALNVKERINKFIRTHQPDRNARYKPQNDRITPTDWLFIERIHSCLEAYYAATKSTEGHSAMLHTWFITLQWLIDEIDAWKNEAVDLMQDDYVAACLTASWNKIEKYYNLVDSTPIYYAAIMLHPQYKAQWFRQNWQSEERLPWIPMIEEKVKAIWRSQYKNANYSSSSSSSALSERIRSPPKDETAFDRLRAAKRLKLSNATPVAADAFDEFLSVDPAPWSEEFDIIKYWTDRKATQPQLAQFALDVFSIPLMSDDNERSFSSGRDMITYRRSLLHGDLIEACQCLKCWWQMPQLPTAQEEDEQDVAEELEQEELAATPQN